MAATSILSTDDEMNAMAGENVDTTGWTDANKTAWGVQAEAYLNSLKPYDFVTNFATLNAKTKAILSEYIARYTGMSGIAYNMINYSSRIEAEDMINIHIWRMEKIEKQLLKQGITDFIKVA